MRPFAIALAALATAAASLPAQAQRTHARPAHAQPAHARSAHARPSQARRAPAQAAQVQNVRGQSPSSVASALTATGRTAKPGSDGVGDPMITGAFNGTNYQIFFYNCTAHKDCATVQFHSGYHLSTPVSLEAINDWNRTQRFGRAYLDKENDPILEMDVDLDDGGVVPLLFIDNVEFWESVLPKFEKHIGYRK